MGARRLPVPCQCTATRPRLTPCLSTFISSIMSSPATENVFESSSSTTEALKNAKFTTAGSVPAQAPVSASDLLMNAYDPAKLHPLAGLGDQVDYLMLDDDKLSALPGSQTAIPSRGWSDDLCYGTGTMYLGGMSCHRSVTTSVSFFWPFSRIPTAHSVLPIFSSYCLARSSHAFSTVPQAWPPAVYGAFVRARVDNWLSLIRVCESMLFSTPSHEEARSWATLPES
jgi:hypothetical protein